MSEIGFSGFASEIDGNSDVTVECNLHPTSLKLFDKEKLHSIEYNPLIPISHLWAVGPVVEAGFPGLPACLK